MSACENEHGICTKNWIPREKLTQGDHACIENKAGQTLAVGNYLRLKTDSNYSKLLEQV